MELDVLDALYGGHMRARTFPPFIRVWAVELARMGVDCGLGEGEWNGRTLGGIWKDWHSLSKVRPHGSQALGEKGEKGREGRKGARRGLLMRTCVRR